MKKIKTLLVICFALVAFAVLAGCEETPACEHETGSWNQVIDKNGIEGAMCSHYLGFAAEESRLNGGEKISLKK